MLVSVIIPNYNHAPYLRQRIDSVLAQSFGDFEVILLDDCSTDNSREVLESYRQHPKVSHLIYNEANSGSVFRQWQKGIELAKGAFIWIAESDDYAHPQFLEQLVPVLQQHPHVGFVYSDAYVVDATGNMAPETFASQRNKDFQSQKWAVNFINNGHKELSENLLRFCTVNNGSSVLFRKASLEAVQPFDRAFKYIGDWYTYIKLCHACDVAFIKEPLNYYRAHGSNASVNLFKELAHLQEYFSLYDWVLKNVDYISPQVIKHCFAPYSRHTLLRHWKTKIPLYIRLHRINPVLFWLALRYNIWAPLRERLYKTS